MIDIAITHHFAATLQAFVDERPGIDLRVSVAPSSQLLSDIRSDELDLAVLVDPGHDLVGVDVTPLIDEPLVSTGRMDVRICRPRDGGRGSDCRRARTRTISSPRRCEMRELTYRLVAESHQPEVLRQMVSLGLGWTVLPVAQAEDIENTMPHRPC